MGLRDEALAAAEAARVARQEAAREILEGRLSPTAIEGLTVVDTTPELVVFGDGAGVFLAVNEQAEALRVMRVTGTPGGAWTAAPRRDVDSLATLGLILDALGEA